MTWLKRVLPAVVAVSLAFPAAAQVTGQPFEVSVGAGIFKYDIRAHVKRGPAFVSTLGWRAQSWLALEGNAAFGPSKADSSHEPKHNFSSFGVDLRWNLRRAEEPVVPFVLTGVGYGLSHTAGGRPDKLERGTGSLGLGILYNVLNPQTYVRLQVRDVMFRDREALQFSHRLAATVGVQVVLGRRYVDQDVDGVRDWLDRCPDTPIGCTVDSRGCPGDSDGDGVCDGVDQCANTPKGCRIDANGCPIDSDGDGVCDGVDTCADTPRGCTVNAAGCPSDADSDGVCDGVDRCAGTPTGCAVDSTGCTTDVDADGVCDALDRCPNTPTGTPVGPTGCPSEIGALERELLETGVVRIKDVTFRAGGVTIVPASFAILDSLARVLQQYPTFKIEIGGPTDVTGDRAVRERLSLDEVRAVTNRFQEAFPVIDVGQYSLRGYDAPAPSQAENRAVRRRIEFKVTNPEELAAEREKRGLPSPGE